MDLFISHSWKDKTTANRLTGDLVKAGYQVWIDHEEIPAGSLIIDRIEKAIAECRQLVLLWSEHSAASRHVNAEWQVAFNLDKGIIPCLLDDTPLPAYLAIILGIDFRANYEEGLDRLIRTAAGNASVMKPPTPSAQPILEHAEAVLAGVARIVEVSRIDKGQSAVINALEGPGPREARKLQRDLDPAMKAALDRWPEDALVLSLAGYHKKNSYRIKHFDDYQAKRAAPHDRLLKESEKFYFKALCIEPGDPSALNGFGSIRMLQGDLDTAEGITCGSRSTAALAGGPYLAAERDLREIQGSRPNEEDDRWCEPW